MTDKQLDALLRQALSPSEQPPEIRPMPIRRKLPLRVYGGVLAACLCVVIATGAFFTFGRKSMDAAPETAWDSDALTQDAAVGDGVKNTAQNSKHEAFADPKAPAAEEELSYGSGDTAGETETPEEPGAEPAILDTGTVMDIVFTHAGADLGHVTYFTLAMDDDEAVRHFDLEFRWEGRLYTYEVNAVTGEIITSTQAAGEPDEVLNGMLDGGADIALDAETEPGDDAALPEIMNGILDGGADIGADATP